MTREEAIKILHEHIHEKSLIFHSLETEAVMRKLAKHLSEDQDMWGVVGLLHDIDYEQTKDHPEKHGIIATKEILKDKLPEHALYAIAAHSYENTGIQPKSKLDFALRCSETVTGLIRANALVRPKKMQGMKVKSVKKKMKDKRFAANVSRERIKECEKIGLDLNEFLQIAISAISEIAKEVELA